MMISPSMMIELILKNSLVATILLNDLAILKTLIHYGATAWAPCLIQDPLPPKPRGQLTVISIH